MFIRSKHLYSNQISGGVSDISSYQILTELIKERCLRDLHLVVLGFHLFVCIASGRSPGRLRLLIRRSEPEPRGPTHGCLSSQLSSISELRGSRRRLKQQYLSQTVSLSPCLMRCWINDWLEYSILRTWSDFRYLNTIAAVSTEIDSV